MLCFRTEKQKPLHTEKKILFCVRLGDLWDKVCFDTIHSLTVDMCPRTSLSDQFIYRIFPSKWNVCWCHSQPVKVLLTTKSSLHIPTNAWSVASPLSEPSRDNEGNTHPNRSCTTNVTWTAQRTPHFNDNNRHKCCLCRTKNILKYPSNDLWCSRRKQCSTFAIVPYLCCQLFHKSNAPTRAHDENESRPSTFMMTAAHSPSSLSKETPQIVVPTALGDVHPLPCKIKVYPTHSKAHRANQTTTENPRILIETVCPKPTAARESQNWEQLV